MARFPSNPDMEEKSIAVDVKRESHIASRLAAARQAVDECDKLFYHLQERLSPVIRNEQIGKKMEEGKGMPLMSSIAAQLMELTAVVHGLEERMRDVLDRCEL